MRLKKIYNKARINNQAINNLYNQNNNNNKNPRKN